MPLITLAECGHQRRFDVPPRTGDFLWCPRCEKYRQHGGTSLVWMVECPDGDYTRGYNSFSAAEAAILRHYQKTEHVGMLNSPPEWLIYDDRQEAPSGCLQPATIESSFDSALPNMRSSVDGSLSRQSHGH